MANNRNELNKNLAQMLKGGVIMDVTTPEQAKIAQDAGACAVMALERIPADIRAAGGVSRMSDPAMIKGIQEAVSIPVMAKVRIGHVAEARILQAIEIDYIDESEVLSPADDVYHIDKNQFDVPFVCGAKNLGEALRRIAEGASMIRTKGEPGTGDVIQAVRHMRTMNKQIRESSPCATTRCMSRQAAGRAVRSRQVCARQRSSAGRQLRRRWRGHSGRCRAHDGTGCRRCVRRFRHLQVRRPGQACRRHRAGHRQLAGRDLLARLSENLARPWSASTKTRSKPSWPPVANDGPHGACVTPLRGQREAPRSRHIRKHRNGNGCSS